MNPDLQSPYDHGKKYGVEHVLAHRSGPVEDVIEEILGISRDTVLWLKSMGSIYRNQKRLQEDLVHLGDHIRVHKEPRRFPLERLSLPEAIVDETDQYLVLNKPKGLPVHATVDNTQENICAKLSKHYGYPLFVTHRLDVPTSGLIVFAKTTAYQTHFNHLLAQGLVEKQYQVQVHGGPVPTGSWVHYMMPSPRAPKQVHREALAGWFKCELVVLESNILSENQSQLRIQLLTGRTHQIRAQLSFEGFPVVGDRAYGSPRPVTSSAEEISLHSCLLKFDGKTYESTPLFLNKTN